MKKLPLIKKYALKLVGFLLIFCVFIAIFISCCSNDSIQVKNPDADTIATVVSELYNAELYDISIQSIHGGVSGDSLYLLRYQNNASVLRIHKKEKSFADKKLEWEATSTASKLGIGPKLLYSSKDFDILVTEFIDALRPNRGIFSDESKLNSLVQSLKKLHNSPEPSREWSVFEYIEKLMPTELDNQQKLAIEKLGEIENAFRAADFPKKACHNDIHPGNLFVINNKVLFIDWGDSGMSDPYWDFARVSIEFLFDTAQDEKFLTKYLGEATSLDHSRLFIMKQIFILQFALRNSNMNGIPEKEDLDTILKVFEINSYPFTSNKNNDLISWKDAANHALEMFLHNFSSTVFQDALRQIYKLEVN